MILPLTNQLGEKLGCAPIPEIEPTQVHLFRPRRKDLWPDDVWAEMQAILNGERDHER